MERGNVTKVKLPFSTKWRRARDEDQTFFFAFSKISFPSFIDA